MKDAPLFRRIAAMLYDGLLILALLFLTTLPFIALRGGEPGYHMRVHLPEGVRGVEGTGRRGCNLCCR